MNDLQIEQKKNLNKYNCGLTLGFTNGCHSWPTLTWVSNIVPISCGTSSSYVRYLYKGHSKREG